MIFCTSACLNHLAKTQVLAHSLKKHMPHSKLVVCLIEKSLPPLTISPVIDEIVLAKDMGYENFESTIFKYNQYEASCFCKGPLLKYVYDKYSEENSIIYIDSDTKIYSRFEELHKIFLSSNIILTPHFVLPPSNTHTIWGENAEILLLRVGVVNGGFIGVKRSEESENFLKWWCLKLRNYAFQDEKNGFFTDQKWLTPALVLFNGIHLFKHRGYNLAFWNVNQYKITETKNTILIENEPLRFFHYSHAKWLSENIDSKEIIITKLLNQYLKELQSVQRDLTEGVNWSYDFFDSGEKISVRSRAAYRNYSAINRKKINPFTLSNEKLV